MTEQPPAQGTATTLPPPSANGASPQPPAAPRPARAGRTHTRISGMRTGLIAGFAGLIVVMIFIIQNAHAVGISFLGAHLRLSLAVALFLPPRHRPVVPQVRLVCAPLTDISTAHACAAREEKPHGIRAEKGHRLSPRGTDRLLKVPSNGGQRRGAEILD